MGCKEAFTGKIPSNSGAVVKIAQLIGCKVLA
jgi:hypothetical protein